MGVLILGAGIAALPVIGIQYVVKPASVLFDAEAHDDTGVASSKEDIIKIADISFMDDRSQNTYATRTLDPTLLVPPSAGRAVVADLSEMMIRVFEDGTAIHEYPIRSKGRPGSLWETPTGAYTIKTKEENHYSTIGNVWMPHSMQFFGNFFIHGWPEYANGSPVPEGFSGGCIRLSKEDAEALFKEMDIGVPVLVISGTGTGIAPDHNENTNTVFSYTGTDSFMPPPFLSARSAFVADLENDFVFFEKNPDEVRAIASLSKLMTALVSLEAINQFKTVTITNEDVEIYGAAGGLSEGDIFEAGELLWPLLLASSNDASYAIARTMGEHWFVSLMNEKAKSLGLTHTSFEEPSGLSPENTSTVIDLFRLTKHLWEDKRSLLIMTQERNHGAWRNIHPFASKDSFLGGKTGYIPEAKRTIIATFLIPFGEFEERPVAVVLLGSDDIRSDVERLRLWVKNNFSYSYENDTQDNQFVLYTPVDDTHNNESLSLLFGGDVMLDRGIENIIEDQRYNWMYPFEQVVQETQRADLAFVNLEGPVSDAGQDRKNLYSFRMNPASMNALLGAGIDVVSLANNHIGDFGREALEDTMRRLHRAQIAYTGAAWNSTELLEPTIRMVKGRRIGFLAFTDVGPDWLSADDALSGIAIASATYVEDTVRQASKKVDILVVSFHFGNEYEARPTKRQQLLARTAIDAGARIIIGHHPHTVQSIEEYRNGVIAYSLGNFIFDQNFSEETSEGLLLNVELTGNEITAVVPIPIGFSDTFQPFIR